VPPGTAALESTRASPSGDPGTGVVLIVLLFAARQSQLPGSAANWRNRIMLLQIGQKPESDFREPIGMLEDCHKRILFFLKNLIRVVSSAGPESLNADQRDVLESALRYFRESAPRHTADEEESLFPRLRQLDRPQIDEVFARIDSLENEHRWADQQHLEVDQICRRWLNAGTCQETELNRLRTILDGLLGFYERHIRLEETEVFSAARALLSDSGKQSIGQEMARRRGIDLKIS
jgi:hemerythrin-like domain-containing protein